MRAGAGLAPGARAVRAGRVGGQAQRDRDAVEGVGEADRRGRLDVGALLRAPLLAAGPTAAALADLGLLNGRDAGGTARYFVSDTPETFAELETLFLGEYAGGPVEQIAIETY